MAVTAQSYFYPPRPEQACAVPQLGLFEAEGWLLQPKMDGVCAVLTITSKGLQKAMTRHGPMSPLKKWNHTAEHSAELANLCHPDGFYVFVGEALEGRTPSPHLAQHPVMLHDILVCAGKPLTGKTYKERYHLLETLTDASGAAQETDTHRVISDRVWLARNYETGFEAVYRDLERKRRWFPEYEGVVLKNPRARLNTCNSPGANTAWQIKSRFPTDKDGALHRSF